MTGPSAAGGVSRARRAAGVAWFLGLLAAVDLFGRFLQSHDWEWGRERCALLFALALGVLVARPACPRILSGRPAAVALGAAALLVLGSLARTGLTSVQHTRETGEIRLDQGQNTLRAARLLLRGEDPYAQGQLLDLEAYFTRREQRAEAGLGPEPDPVRARQLAAHWWARLDPEARARLLPPAPPGNAAAAAERSLYGYKYGPVLPLVTAPVQALAGPAAVPLLQLGWWAAWMALLLFCMRSAGVCWGAAALFLACVGLEPNVATNALQLTASDVWVLALMTAGLLAFLRGRPVALGLCVAAAMGCKLFPALLLAPLLLVPPPGCGERGRRAALLACGAGLAALFLPFLIWDAAGFWANAVLWPSAMRPDNTHWSFYASPSLRLAAGAVLGCAVAAGAVVLVRRREQGAAAWLKYLAASSAALVLAGVAFHNNYAPWFTVWALGAVIASGCGPLSASAQAPAASGNR
jgi:hypothetical protein